MISPSCCPPRPHEPERPDPPRRSRPPNSYTTSRDTTRLGRLAKNFRFMNPVATAYLEDAAWDLGRVQMRRRDDYTGMPKPSRAAERMIAAEHRRATGCSKAGACVPMPKATKAAARVWLAERLELLSAIEALPLGDYARKSFRWQIQHTRKIEEHLPHV